MASGRKKSYGLYKEGDEWFFNASLPRDAVIQLDEATFHLHKFPLLSRCGKIEKMLNESEGKIEETFHANLSGCPGGFETFVTVAKFCYGLKVELAPENVALIYCAAEYLEMTEDYGDDNLLVKCEDFLHKNILQNWKDSILCLHSCDSVLSEAEALHIVSRCIDAVSTMACTDPSLFGWPMMMYGRLQSPGGSILWNGINTGAKIRASLPDWWFDDVSILSLPLFEKLIETMVSKGMRSQSIAGAVMHYTTKYIPGLIRWHGAHGSISGSMLQVSTSLVLLDPKAILESVVFLLPERKGKTSCRFLLGALRIANIVDASRSCKDKLERRIGIQLDLATLDGLLIPSYSDSDTLYDTECVDRIVRHFLSRESQSVPLLSPSSIEHEDAEFPYAASLRKVAKLLDNYIAEIAPDVNLKPEKFQSLAEALPEDSRTLEDGLYRAVDIYLKAHAWLSEKDKEQICSVINYRNLSMDACIHAAHNERLPLRVVIRVLFFEQLHLRNVVASCFNASDNENAATNAATLSTTVRNDSAGQVVQRDGWVAAVRENQVLKVDLERLRSKVGKLEEEFGSIKHHLHKIGHTKSPSSNAPRLLPRGIGCNLLAKPNQQPSVVESTIASPRRSEKQEITSQQHRRRKSLTVY